MNWHVLLRAVFLSIPRFLVITVLMTAYAWIDWTPLPEKPFLFTLTTLTQLVVTYVFARWVFGKYKTTWKDVTLAYLVVVIVQIACEAWYQAIRTGGDFIKLATTYNWWSLLTLAVYVLAFFLAFERGHSKYHSEMPEGMSM